MPVSHSALCHIFAALLRSSAYGPCCYLTLSSAEPLTLTVNTTDDSQPCWCVQVHLRLLPWSLVLMFSVLFSIPIHHSGWPAIRWMDVLMFIQKSQAHRPLQLWFSSQLASRSFHHAYDLTFSHIYWMLFCERASQVRKSLKQLGVKGFEARPWDSNQQPSVHRYSAPTRRITQRPHAAPWVWCPLVRTVGGCGVR